MGRDREREALRYDRIHRASSHGRHNLSVGRGMESLPTISKDVALVRMICRFRSMANHRIPEQSGCSFVKQMIMSVSHVQHPVFVSSYAEWNDPILFYSRSMDSNDLSASYQHYNLTLILIFT